jgi:hypothetical protein
LYRSGVARALPATPGGLPSGGGIGEVRTRAKNRYSAHTVGRATPPLAANRLLQAVLFYLLYHNYSQNYKNYLNFSLLFQSVPHQNRTNCKFSVDCLPIFSPNRKIALFSVVFRTQQGRRDFC